MEQILTHEPPIFNLAQDHLFSILLLLPTSTILSFAQTCKKFQSLTSSNNFWESICRRDWGPTCVDAIKNSSFYSNSDNLTIYSNNSSSGGGGSVMWMRLYREVAQLRGVSCYKLVEDDDDNDLIPCPRASHSLNFVNNCLVLFGGGCEGGRHRDDTWVAYLGYDLKTVSKWQKVTSGLPTGRFGHTCVVTGDALVLFGGINDHGLRQNDTWVGNIAQNESTSDFSLFWKELDKGSTSPPPPSPPPRGAHAGCCINNRKMLIHGGIGLDGVRLGDMWILELSENYSHGTWNEVITHPSPPPRSGHTLTSIDGSRAVLFGGRGSGYDVLDDVWIFDAGPDKWVKVNVDIPNVPRGSSLARVGHSATLILGGGLLIFGGEDSLRRRKRDFWLLDLNSIPGIKMHPFSSSSRSVVTRMWRSLKSQSHGFNTNSRSFHSACADQSGRFVYMFGGMVDGVVLPAESSGLRFDGDLFLVELCLTNG